MIPDNIPRVGFEISNKVSFPSAGSFLVKKLCAHIAAFDLGSRSYSDSVVM
jgi:hypothetical protein